MYKVIEVELTEVLKGHGFSRIAIEGNTLVVIYNDGWIRSQIAVSDWTTTIESFRKYAKELISKKETLQAVISFISSKWFELVEQQRQNNQRSEDKTGSDDDIASSSSSSSSSDSKKEPEEDQNLQDLLPRDTKPVEYSIDIIKRNIKGEDPNIRIIVYAGLSARTFNPLSVALRAPTSEGKTHLVVGALSPFPREDVMFVGSMSPKVLIRQIGLLVDENNEPLQPRINELKRQIKIAREEEKAHFQELRHRIKRKQPGFRDVDITGRPVIEVEPDTYESRTGKTLEELEDDLEKLYDNSRYIIDLHGRILVFLEPPHPEVWAILKPMLSHDHWEIEHPYVDTNLRTKNVVTRGWPVCFFCTARDETRWEIWPEIASRFLVISPNMSEEKYEQANMLTFQKLGLPDFAQQRVILSNEEMATAHKCILAQISQIKELCVLPEYSAATKLGIEYKPKNPVWIPYQEYLGASLPHTKGVEMRAAKYVGSLLHVVAITKSPFRLDTGEGTKTNVIARPEDLVETQRLIEDLISGEYSGIPAHKIKFFQETFLPAYEDKEGPDEKDGKVESLKALTTNELSKHYKQVTGKGIDPNNLQKQFLEELVANDLIGKMQSEVDKRRQVYWPLNEPLVESVNREAANTETQKFKNGSPFLNILDVPTLRLSKYYKEIAKDWLIIQILTLVKYRIEFDQIRGPFADFLNNCEELKFLEINGCMIDLLNSFLDLQNGFYQMERLIAITIAVYRLETVYLEYQDHITPNSF